MCSCELESWRLRQEAEKKKEKLEPCSWGGYPPSPAMYEEDGVDEDRPY